MKRSESREAAFLLLFEYCFRPEAQLEELISARDSDEFPYDDYTVSLTRGVIEEVEHLDTVIDTYSTKWRSSRLSKATLTALRMAVYEIEHAERDNLEAVYINEAVNLIKKYDSVDSSKYANGILGAYVGKK